MMRIRDKIVSRRSFLQGCVTAGACATFPIDAMAMPPRAEVADYSTACRPYHLSPRAQRMVLLFQHGGPSQIDLFDPKPKLSLYAGQKMPGGVEAFFDQQDSSVCTPSPFRFSQYGECGMQFSELLPYLASCADQLCMVRSLHTLVNDHEGALRHFQTGKPRVGHPSLGAWITYALGTHNQALPPYVVLSDPTHDQVDGIRNWTAGFLPALYQGTPLRCDGPPLYDMTPPPGVTDDLQQRQLALLERFNRQHRQRFPHNSELAARMVNNDLALAIGQEVSAALDLAGETSHMLETYGCHDPGTGTYGRRCLMARRLLERGVRYVALFNDNVDQMGDPWDTHTNHNARLRTVAKNVDQPSAALIHDLQQRGLLEDTIVLWIGEFGRLPVAQGNDGRDHNRHAFTALLAGGGFRPGLTYGTTDEFGYKIVERPVSVGALHATLLQQLGLDHQRLTVPHQGRLTSLTDAEITHVAPVSDLVG